MEQKTAGGVDPAFLRNALASFIQIATLSALAWGCFVILRPFLGIVAWGIIIAVAIYPLHLQLMGLLGGRAKASAFLLVALGLALIVLPAWLMTGPTAGSVRSYAAKIEAGEQIVPPPSPQVKDWPVVGPQAYQTWSEASQNLEAALEHYRPQVAGLVKRILKIVGGLLMGTIQFALSLVIAGALLVGAEAGGRTARVIARRLAGPRGDELVALSAATIRSVTKGILGVALIQAGLSLVAMLLVHVPAAGLWAALVMVLAIVQLPPLLVLAPVAVWVFSTANPVAASLFAIAAVIISFSDAVLKPALLGRGVDVPMLAIFVGAIGGAIAGGVIGLFVGSVVLVLGYKLLSVWMAGAPAVGAEAAGAGTPSGAGPVA